VKLKGKSLDKWIASKGAESFPPDRGNYPVKFSYLADQLNTWVHPSVVAGAQIADPAFFLTGHGVAHIRSVIKRATQLVTSEKCVLTPYEAYVLLLAIHVHDIGNVLGRLSHEQNALQVLNALNLIPNQDQFEWAMITSISAAHGGTIDGDKNKIAKTLREGAPPIFDFPVRLRFLAAILRLADELADEPSRANLLIETLNLTPKRSALYHAYASALHSTRVDFAGKAIELFFELELKTAERVYEDKDGKRIMLIDEIHKRVCKMHTELRYCMRFLRPDIDLDKIRVSIKVSDSGFFPLLEEIRYDVEETGYPSEVPASTFWENGTDYSGAKVASRCKRLKLKKNSVNETKTQRGNPKAMGFSRKPTNLQPKVKSRPAKRSTQQSRKRQ
jgi:hypothetical protein